VRFAPLLYNYNTLPQDGAYKSYLSNLLYLGPLRDFMNMSTNYSLVLF